MSSPIQEESIGSEDIQKPEVVDEAEEATSSAPNKDIFVEIDKRLGLLLDRANKLEDTLNQLNGKRMNVEQDVDLSEDVESEEIFKDIDFTESADLNLDTEDNDVMIDDISENMDKIYLDIQDD